jgi:hypothetical protein
MGLLSDVVCKQLLVAYDLCQSMPSFGIGLLQFQALWQKTCAETHAVCSHDTVYAASKPCQLLSVSLSSNGTVCKQLLVAKEQASNNVDSW